VFDKAKKKKHFSGRENEKLNKRRISKSCVNAKDSERVDLHQDTPFIF
jgi:hypothetical protein